MHKFTPFIFLLVFLFSENQFSFAQSVSNSSYSAAQPITDRTVLFDYAGTGVSKPMIWGMDAGGWTSPLIWTTGINYIGAQNINITRIPVFPTDILYGDTLQQNQKNLLKDRLNQVAAVGHPVQVMLNHGGGEISWYSRDAIGHARYALLMELSKKYIESFGHTVVSITGYNEPDYGWDGATMDDFKNFIAACKQRPALANLRFCGGNTLNNDQALAWYNYVKPSGLNEGNTHQLAGSFDTYAAFYQTVRANGHYATNDEVHDIMEGIVGAEYGMQAGIYWGYANLARGEFSKATSGVRLGYAEHRPNWTAAAVYRKPDGQVQAFGGVSERQAVTTTYRFLSKDKDVYYEGEGPKREHVLEMPGGSGYMTADQRYAERVINLSWGDDIQQAVNGRYVIANRMSSKVIEVQGSSTTGGTYLCQRTYKQTANQQWNVTPVNNRVGGDFSYFTLTNVNSNKVADLLNYSLDNGGRVIQWDNANGGNQQWYFDYAGNGWFYIKNRHSSKCLEIAAPYITEGLYIQQNNFTGAKNQQWRFMPTDATVEFTAPSIPSGLVASPLAESVKLQWDTVADADVTGYNIYRSESADGKFNTIARNVKSNTFTDNSMTENGQFFYKIKAVDKSLNTSDFSLTADANTVETKSLIANFLFSGNLKDTTENAFHAASLGAISYTSDAFTTNAVSLNGKDAFIQLPATIVNQKEITISAWVYYRGLTPWQRIFDFGNDVNQYMFLTPRTSSGVMRFAIKNGGTEQTISTTAAPYYKWTHVAVTMGTSGTSIYVNGNLAVQSSAITIRPADFKPVANYIGRSQYSDPLFNGNMEDFRIYNYALSASEISQIASVYSGTEDLLADKNTFAMYPVPADQTVYMEFSEPADAHTHITLFDMNGRKVLTMQAAPGLKSEINVSSIPSGMYLMQMTSAHESVQKRLIIMHP